MMPYRPTDPWVKLPALGPTKASFGMTPLKVPNKEERTVAGVSLGPHLNGASMPHPDIGDQFGAQLACRKRFGTRMPKFNHKLVRRLERFTKKWLKKNLNPFDPMHQFRFEEWLAETNYTEARKQELREIWNGSLNLIDRHTVRAKCFVKDEYYPEYKYPRAINSRDDAFKTFFGPVVKEIESRLYKFPAFIKHTPVADRPEYITSRLSRTGAKYFGTDFTSFESSFVQKIMLRLEYLLFEHMLKGHWIWEIVNKMTLSAKASFNVLLFKTFKCWIVATRLSGEMDTSCSNGFSNLMINSFLLEKICKVKWYDGVVEGDDGLFAFIGEGPTSKMYADLGFNIKIQYFESLFEASFCGIVFDEATLVNVACPYKNLAKFGWTTHQYAKASRVTKLKLLRSKGLSLLSQYPGCPVLQELGQYAVRVTKHVNLGNFVNQADGWWERELAKINSATPIATKPVEMSTRLLMERTFGMSVSEQLRIEEYLSKKTDLSPIEIDINSFPDLWVRNFYIYGIPSSEISSFNMAIKNKFNCGFELKQVFEPDGRSYKWVQVGYVEHKGTRFYDSIVRNQPQLPFFPPYMNA